MTKPPFGDEHGFIAFAKAKMLFQQKETNEMNGFSESIEKNWRKTYLRVLSDGVKLEAEVSPCVYMTQGYPLQVEVTLRRHSNECLGKAFATNRTKTADTYTDADVEELMAGIRIIPCHRCAAPAFQPETVETNRNGLCESCFMSDLEADVAKAEEADRQETAARDLRMKKEGMSVRISAWVHPEGGGDDYQVDWYLEARPTAEGVRSLLREQHSSRLDDYQIITL
jgi:hypothetical protein